MSSSDDNNPWSLVRSGITVNDKNQIQTQVSNHGLSMQDKRTIIEGKNRLLRETDLLDLPFASTQRPQFRHHYLGGMTTIPEDSLSSGEVSLPSNSYSPGLLEVPAPSTALTFDEDTLKPVVLNKNRYDFNYFEPKRMTSPSLSYSYLNREAATTPMPREDDPSIVSEENVEDVVDSRAVEEEAEGEIFFQS